MDDSPAPTQFDYQLPDNPAPVVADYPDQSDRPAEDDGGYQFSAQPGTALADNTSPAAVLTEQPTPSPVNVTSNPATVYTGLSGNELYCLDKVGYAPGNLVVGNSVYALGYIGSLTSGIRTTIGGEIQQFTNMIFGGRQLALQRLEKELTQLSCHGATGVTSELVFPPRPH